MKTGKAVLGAVAGLAIGAVTSILFAPEKGSKTRKQIVDKGDGLVDKIKSKYDEFRVSLTEKFDRTKNDAENLAEKGKAKFDDAKKEVKNAASNLKHDGPTAG